MKRTHMDIALEEARAAAERGEVPVGAVVVKDRVIIARSGNRVIELRDPTAHAEMLVLRDASRILGSERLCDADLYTTLEPCPMCAGAIALARIRRLYYGSDDPKGGAVENGVRLFTQPSCHHRPDIYPGIGATASAEMLTAFFKARR